MKKIISSVRKKLIIYTIGALVCAALVWVIFLRNGNVEPQTLVVHPHDFVQEVSVSGKIVSAEVLDLSFEQSGRVVRIGVRVGDRVGVGQVLASQDTAELDAKLAEMRASIDVQKAKLAQIHVGASTQDIQVSETAVANAHVAVHNAEYAITDAEQGLMDKLQDAYTKSDDAVRGKADQLFSNPKSTNPKLLSIFSGSQIQKDTEWKRVLIESMLTTWAGSVHDMTLASDLTSAAISAHTNLNFVKSFLDQLSLGVNALTSNSETSQATIDKWKTDISTARANVNTAFSNLSAAQENREAKEADLRTTQGSLQTAEDLLVLKKAPARSPDIEVYEAQIRQAEAGAQSALAQLAKKQIHSPISGVVTIVPGKAGSIVSPNETVVSLMSVGTFQAESYVPEKSIPFIKVGDKAVITLDAYGSSVLFAATVASLDPAETLRDGVPTYRAILQILDHDERIKSGMTANVLVTTEKKSNVITVPQGIVSNKNGKKFVKVKSGDGISEREVQTGSVSSLGEVEIISGLADGETIILEQAK